MSVAEVLASLTRSSSSFASDQPIREELFSVERLEHYAQTLAAEHRTVHRKGRARLLPRVEDNGRKLVFAYRTLVDSLRSGQSISDRKSTRLNSSHLVI